MQSKEINTIERIVPSIVTADNIMGQAALELHLQRYEFAAKHAISGRLLDIACGVGYGTHFMADKRDDIYEAIGVDISKEAIAYAMQYYAKPHVHFKQHDALTFNDEKGFDTIVSVETLEHIPKPYLLIKQLSKLLRENGVFIASVPTTPSVDVNPYHLFDFTERSFRKMVTKYGFKEITCFKQIQPYPIMKTLKRKEPRMKDMRQHLVLYYLKHPIAALKRLWSTFRYGFTNRYITIVWQKEQSTVIK